MELRHLRYFIAVAEELHFRRAAARLHIAQPPLSIQIRELERELGVTLLARTHRRVDLTEAGRVFLDGARRTLTQLDAAISDAQRAERGQTGRLNIGFVSSSSYELLPRLLVAFRAIYPDVALHLQAATTNEQLAALDERRLDLGILRLPVNDGRLAWQVLAEEPLVTVLPVSHPLALLERTPLASLAQESFILYPRVDNPAIHDAIIACCHMAGFSPRITQETGDMQAITALVASGLGVALVIASPGLPALPGVTLRPLAGRDIPTWRIALAWRREPDPAPAVRAFVAVSAALTPEAWTIARGESLPEPDD